MSASPIVTVSSAPTEIAPVGEAVVVVDALPANTNAAPASGPSPHDPAWTEPASWAARSELWRIIARIFVKNPVATDSEAWRLAGMTWSSAMTTFVRADLRAEGFYMPQRGVAQIAPEQAEIFLAAFGETKSIRRSAKRAGFSRFVGARLLRGRGIDVTPEPIAPPEPAPKVTKSGPRGFTNVQKSLTPAQKIVRAAMLAAFDPARIKKIAPEALEIRDRPTALYEDTPAEIAARERRREQVRIEHAVDREVRSATGSEVLVEGQILGIGSAAIFARRDFGDVLRASNDGELEFEWRSGMRLFWQDDLREWMARPAKPDRRKMVLSTPKTP